MIRLHTFKLTTNFTQKIKNLSTLVSKREKVFTMNPNLLDDFHSCSSEFLIVFISSLSIMATGEEISRCEKECLKSGETNRYTPFLTLRFESIC